MAEYETHQLQLPRTVSRRVVRQLLVDRAERGGWELLRVRVHPDGRRVVTLRRRIIRVTKTMPPTGAWASAL
ncbi:DUF5703 family protein [Thermasporomyces composti]|uniref:DUF4177 domain-containing protein n=1 Tax=Thermasporomyces composti TaxID=696763 RepID=A0A3D9VCA7_THECX|nr:DUF5703 family protein [Thermasporomyces composti]REF38333.1 hypothetical protein DFJ64_3810 [Thermasporomyces composti]